MNNIVKLWCNKNNRNIDENKSASKHELSDSVMSASILLVCFGAATYFLTECDSYKACHCNETNAESLRLLSGEDKQRTKNEKNIIKHVFYTEIQRQTTCNIAVNAVIRKHLLHSLTVYKQQLLPPGETITQENLLNKWDSSNLWLLTFT